MLPFLSSYDPSATSEGTLDPLGLYQIADQLATRLVPAVRERMARIRFLTAMAVGAIVTEDLETNPDQPEAPPFLVWEWLVVEAIIRTMDGEEGLRGVPGTYVTRRALDEYGYLDHRSYLKTPRIFGFHGVYKRLAIHLGLVDVHLGPRPQCEHLVDVWSRDMGYGGIQKCRPLLDRWRRAVQRSVQQDPARTRPGWGKDAWTEIANAFAPQQVGRREKKHLQNLLHATDDQALGALPAIWNLQETFDDDTYAEATLHDRLKRQLPSYAALLEAIKAYERFCRAIQDAFHILIATAAGLDAHGFEVPSIASDEQFAGSVRELHRHYEEAGQRLGEVDSQIPSLFNQRFAPFAEPMNARVCASAICDHHEKIQKGKSPDGKRPWFDRLGPDRIYVRHRYREDRPDVLPGQYVHQYRGVPIRSFYQDLT